MLGGNWFKASDDVTMRNGRQHITRADGVDAHVALIGSVAYVSGNYQALTGYFGLSASVAHLVGTRWIRVPSSDRGWYPNIAADATLSSALSEIEPTGNLVELPARTIDGLPVVGVRGGMPKGFVGGGTDTVWLTRSAHPALVSAVLANASQKVTITFSHWGERVVIAPPSDWIAVNKI